MAWLWWLTMIPALILFGMIWILAFPPLSEWDEDGRDE